MKRKIYIISSFLIILSVTLLILWKNDFSVKYKSADKLIDNFYDFYYSCRYENSLEDYEDYLENKNLFIIIGEYYNGYVLLKHSNHVYEGVYPKVYTLKINGIEINLPDGDDLWYYKDKINEGDIISRFDKAYEKKYIFDDDVIDIKNKLELYKDSEKPYYIPNHLILN